MTLYQKMLVFYAVMGCICAVISWFLTKESRWIRLLAALLMGRPGRSVSPWRCWSPCFDFKNRSLTPGDGDTKNGRS
jgi:hypothetical protein